VTILGTPRADVIRGTERRDVIHALGGSDLIEGGAGDDVVCGGPGIDTMSYSGAPGPVQVRLASGKSSGAAGSDRFVGVERATGSRFADRIMGGALAHLGIEGGDGNDVLGSALVVDGGPGTDELFYGDQPAAVRVDLGRGLAETWLGFETIRSIENVTGSRFYDSLIGDDGPNRLAANSGGGTMAGAGGNDLLEGGDLLDILTGGAGDDVLVGGDNFDIVTYYGAPGPVQVRLWAGVATGDGTETLISIEHIYGSQHDDQLEGTDGWNHIYGAAGDDVIVGFGGNDQLDGGWAPVPENSLDGGDGTDSCAAARTTVACEFHW
jgi:Ca2+-binding RTX toxin-like protein